MVQIRPLHIEVGQFGLGAAHGDVVHFFVADVRDTDGVNDGLDKGDPTSHHGRLAQIPQKGNGRRRRLQELKAEKDHIKFLLDLIAESRDDNGSLDGHGWVDGGVWISSGVPQRHFLPHAFFTKLRG
jgi:hypothetical protein